MKYNKWLRAYLNSKTGKHYSMYEKRITPVTYKDPIKMPKLQPGTYQTSNGQYSLVPYHDKKKDQSLLRVEQRNNLFGTRSNSTLPTTVGGTRGKKRPLRMYPVTGSPRYKPGTKRYPLSKSAPKGSPTSNTKTDTKYRLRPFPRTRVRTDTLDRRKPKTNTTTNVEIKKRPQTLTSIGSRGKKKETKKLRS